MRRSLRAVRNGGFTLIELLVALVVSGIMVTAVFQLILGQTRITRLTTAREEVQQNARAAVELISSELRGVNPHSIQVAGANEIVFLQPRLTGLVCAEAASGATIAQVRFPAGMLGQIGFALNDRRWGIAVAQTTDPTGVPLNWSYGRGLTSVATTTGCAVTSAITLGPGIDVDDRGFVSPTVLASGTAVAAGSRAYLFEEVRYRLASNRIERLRGYSGTTPLFDPVIEPVETAAGLSFTYLNAQGAAIAQPVTGAAIGTIARIRVEVRGESTAHIGTGPQRDRAATTVTLRNFN